MLSSVLVYARLPPDQIHSTATTACLVSWLIDIRGGSERQNWDGVVSEASTGQNNGTLMYPETANLD